MKALLSLLFLGAVAFCATKILPAYVRNYEFQNYLNRIAVEASVRHPQQRPEALQNKIYTKAESLGLPVERQNIQVSVGQTVLIHVKYSVFVDLIIYTLPLQFRPSAKNSNI